MNNFFSGSCFDFRYFSWRFLYSEKVRIPPLRDIQLTNLVPNQCYLLLNNHIEQKTNFVLSKISNFISVFDYLRKRFKNNPRAIMLRIINIYRIFFLIGIDTNRIILLYLTVFLRIKDINPDIYQYSRRKWERLSRESNLSPKSPSAIIKWKNKLRIRCFREKSN